MENATWIAASRYLSAHAREGDGEALLPAMVRLEQMQFVKPARVGEVMSLDARVVFCSRRSLAVAVTVTSEDLPKGITRETNSALVWYVAYSASGMKEARAVAGPTTGHGASAEPQPVAPFDASALQDEPRFAAWGVKAAQQYAERRSCMGEPKPLAPPPPQAAPSFGRSASGLTLVDNQRDDAPRISEGLDADVGLANAQLATSRVPAGSITELSQLLLPSDCTQSGYCRGGVLLKLMDECAGVAAFRHARQAGVVTASFEAVDFVSPAKNGDVVRLVGQVAFASARSLDVRVRVYVDRGTQNAALEEKLVASSHIIFVAFDQHGDVATVPPVKPTTDAERALYVEAKDSYDERKRKRAAEKEAAAKRVASEQG